MRSSCLNFELEMTYDELIQNKLKAKPPCGFEPIHGVIPSGLWDWQRLIVDWACRRGQAAIFAECGLGKTVMQLEWASQVCIETDGSVLIACPLAVAHQTKEEGRRFGYDSKIIREPEDFQRGINIVNYDRIEKIDPGLFSGIVLDESSILKSLTGSTRQMLTQRFRETAYKLCCTATPAPNDFTELGQHADFLNICSPAEMLATYFINDAADTGEWRLKGHAQEEFWRWVSTWAACISSPSDLGFDDEGFILPPVNQKVINVAVDHRATNGSGELLRNPNVSATAMFGERRRTLMDRVAKVAEIVISTDEPFIVWCETNEESAELAKIIPDCVEVVGSDDAEEKEAKLIAFSSGEVSRIVTKPKIAGFGMNWQHCRNEIYAGLTHSYERFYQASKRIHRFGQKREVNRYIVKTDLDDGIIRAIERKSAQHDTIRALVNFTAQNLNVAKVETHMNDKLERATGDGWELWHGDCVRVAEQMANESVDFSIFSPPFADLFTYSNDIQDMGNCRNLDEFMQQFRFLAEQLLRVTLPGRECAIHCCDLLATKWKDGQIEFKDFSGAIASLFRSIGWQLHSRVTIWKDPVVEMQRTKSHGLLFKTLCKDSSCSRVGAADYLMVFRKPGINPKPIRHDASAFSLDRWQEIASPVWMTIDQGNVLNGKGATEQQDERHICPLQLDVIERALALWSNRDDLVYSPFAGIGSEGYVALKHHRRFIGSELKRSYWESAKAHLRHAAAEKDDLFRMAGVAV